MPPSRPEVMQVMLVGVLSNTLHLLQLNCTCTSAALVEKSVAAMTASHGDASHACTQVATSASAVDSTPTQGPA